MATIILMLVIIGIIVFIISSVNKKKLIEKKVDQKFPEAWRTVLNKRVLFYIRLKDSEKRMFENRIQYFLATKSIEGIDTDIDDTIRLMVASSAIIPTFAFPKYNYPHIYSVLIYPNSFDGKFRTKRYNGNKEFITGMVDGRSQNNTIILSKPDLVMAFDGMPHKSNVGIHEFVHLLDKEDGVIDGIPEILVQHSFVGPWLYEIKQEIKRIEKGKSDIDPYALTGNAEFLAVVSEYFFENPEKFNRRHPELYQFLSVIFNQNKSVSHAI